MTSQPLWFLDQDEGCDEGQAPPPDWLFALAEDLAAAAPAGDGPLPGLTWLSAAESAAEKEALVAAYADERPRPGGYRLSPALRAACQARLGAAVPLLR